MKRLVVLLAVALATVPSAGTSANQSEDTAKMRTLTLTLRSTRYGPVLFDGKNRVLYGFTRDRRGGPSRCYGACAAAWPVYYSKGGGLRAGRGVRQALLGTVRRRDGRRQVTYNGWPLYYYAHEGPGEVKCQNVREFGGLWLVVRANGRLVR
jgi:predicted lipoprotein with Yx(FWY)xxD motif